MDNDNVDHRAWREHLEILASRGFKDLRSRGKYFYHALSNLMEQSCAFEVLWHFLIKKIKRRLGFNNIKYDNSIVSENLRKIKEWTDERKIPLIVLSYETSSILEQLCHALNVPLYDISLTKEERILFRNSYFDAHPNVEGHLQIARNILMKLSKSEWAEFFFGPKEPHSYPASFILEKTEHLQKNILGESTIR